MQSGGDCEDSSEPRRTERSDSAGSTRSGRPHHLCRRADRPLDGLLADAAGGCVWRVGVGAVMNWRTQLDENGIQLHATRSLEEADLNYRAREAYQAEKAGLLLPPSTEGREPEQLSLFAALGTREGDDHGLD